MTVPPFEALIDRWVGPVLVRAGFSAGQWADAPVAGDTVGTAIFCASGSDYVARYPHLTDNGPQWDDTYCVDLIIEGSLRGGIVRIEVEYESLAQLLERTGRVAEALRLSTLAALQDPDEDAREVAEILSDLYAGPS